MWYFWNRTSLHFTHIVGGQSDYAPSTKYHFSAIRHEPH